MWLDEKNPEDPYNRSQSQPNNLSVGTGGGVTQSSGTTSNPSTTNPIQPTAPAQSFGTVQDYLGANKQQGEQLGQQFTGSLAKSATNEKQAIDTAAGQTSQDITAGSTPFNADLINKASTDPTKITGNPDDLNSFLKQWNASYTGPSSFENSANYAPATTAVTEAATKQAEAGTTGGQQQLLQDEFGVYGQGNKGLDQNLIQNSSANPAIQAQAKQFGTLPDYLKNAAAPVNAQATKAAADTAATQAQTQGAFANTLTDFQKQLNDKVAADRAAAITDYANITNGALNPASAITSTNVATPQDYANAAAYQQLTGKDFSGILNPANANQAGTWGQQYANAPTTPEGAKNLGLGGSQILPIGTLPSDRTNSLLAERDAIDKGLTDPAQRAANDAAYAKEIEAIGGTVTPPSVYIAPPSLPAYLTPAPPSAVVEPPLAPTPPVSAPLSQATKLKTDAKNQIDLLTKRMATLPAHSGERGMDEDQITKLKKQYSLAGGGIVKRDLKDYLKEVK